MTQETTIEGIELLGSFLLKQNIDLNRRVIYINGGISPKSTDKFIRSLSFLESLSRDPITVIINSHGGDVYSGFSIIDAIENSHCEIITVGTGLVASMAVPILCAGNVRKGTRMLTLMYHEISCGHPLERLTAAEIETKHSKDLNAKMNQYMASQTSKPYHFWSRVGKHLDYYFDIDKALELGVIDEVCSGI